MVRILSGMRPTGKMHLGHYFGVLQNWVSLQQDHECFFMIADWHALTDREKFSDLKELIEDIVLSWLAVGLDPEKAVIFRQSEVVEHAELEVLLSMVAKMGDLKRIPSYKDADAKLKRRVGFFLYPLLQSADILLYRAEKVPVGEDQVPHIEYARVLARAINRLAKQEILPEPEPLLSEAKKVPGIDGEAKMSKSLNNVIELEETDFESLWEKLATVPTDPQRVRKEDPGEPKKCPVIYPYAKLVLTEEELKEIEEHCRKAKWGCLDCKRRVALALDEFFSPFRAELERLRKRKGIAQEVLAYGRKMAKKEAQKTLNLIRPVFGL
ncbi:tryptophan--tRNA ligase [bacterium]|nr:tryptophan--tRNA ligase [bacterium]